MNTYPPPIFIVGAPRSGTTWLLSMLEKHPQCRASTPEAPCIAHTRPNKEKDIFQIVSHFARLSGDCTLVDATQGNLLLAGRIKRFFPHARIVLVRRNPMDVIWSMIQEHAFLNRGPRTLQEALNLYNTYSAAGAAYSGFDAVVDYEALWESPAEILAGLLFELGLDPVPAAELVARPLEGKAQAQSLANALLNEAPGEGSAHFSSADQALIEANLLPVHHPARSRLILLTTNHLFGWTGSETLLLTLIDGLLGCGCSIAVYVRHWNPEWLDAYFDPRVRLTDDLKSLQHLSFDVAHVQHNACLVDVRATFPTLPVIFSSLGVLPFLEQPVPFDLGVSRCLAISEEVAANLVSHGIPEHRIRIVRNLVSGRRFCPNNKIRERPERILVLSYRMEEGKRSLLRAAARRIGASIRFTGGAEGVITQDRLVAAINEADVVVSLGRGVVEAMLCGRVPLVFDIHGGDGLVTPNTLNEIRKNNFSGRRHRRNYTVEDLVAELDKYRQEYGSLLRELALEQFGAEQNMPPLLELYDSLIDEPAPTPPTDMMSKILSYCSAISREDMQLAKHIWESEHSLHIMRIKRTVSWRITAPLRLVWKICAKLIRKFGSGG